METRTTRPVSPTTSLTRPTTRRRELELDGLTWIDIPQPVNTDIAELRERLRLDVLALDDVLSTIQRPKLDSYEAQEYLFLVIQVPIFDRDQRVVMSEIDIFAGRDYVVTLHDGTIKPLRRMFATAASEGAARKQVMGRGSGYLLYRILDVVIKQSFPIIYHLDEELGRLSARVFTFETTKLLEVHSLLERDLITLQQIIEPNRAVSEALRSQRLAFLRLDTARFFADTADAIHKLYGLATERRALVASLGATIATRSIQQQRQTQQYIFATLLILAPLLALAALATLAVVAPPSDQPIVFGAAIIVVIASAGGLIGFARSRRWI